VVRGLDFTTAPLTNAGPAMRLSDGARLIAAFDPDHPFLAEKTAERARALILTSTQVANRWEGGRALYAAMVCHLAGVAGPERDRRVREAQRQRLASLAELSPALVNAEAEDDDGRVAITLSNASGQLALMVHIEPESPGGLPLSFSDNFFALLPGESRTIWVETTVGSEGETRLCLGGLNVPRRPLPWRLRSRGRTLRLRR